MSQTPDATHEKKRNGNGGNDCKCYTITVDKNGDFGDYDDQHNEYALKYNVDAYLAEIGQDHCYMYCTFSPDPPHDVRQGGGTIKIGS